MKCHLFLGLWARDQLPASCRLASTCRRCSARSCISSCDRILLWRPAKILQQQLLCWHRSLLPALVLPALPLDNAAEVEWLHASFRLQLLPTAARLSAPLSVLLGLQAAAVVRKLCRSFQALPLPVLRLQVTVSFSGPPLCSAAAAASAGPCARLIAPLPPTWER